MKYRINKHMAKRMSITPGIKTKINIKDKDTEGLGQKSQEAAPLRSGIGDGFKQKKGEDNLER